MTIPEAMRTAVQLHQAGRLAEAEQIYRQILAADANHADALHMLGVVAHQVGRNDAAEDLIRRAIALNPGGSAPYLSNLGLVLVALGRAEEAVAAFRRALELHPDFAEVHNNLGSALMILGRKEEAAAACRRALELRPDYAEAWNILGNALSQLGRHDESAAASRRAVEIAPAYAEGWNNLGSTFCVLGRFHEAIAAYRRAIEINPGYADALSNLGNALRSTAEFDEGETVCRRAIAIRPDHPQAWNILGTILSHQQRYDEACAAFREAFRLSPDFAEAWNNLGIALSHQNRMDDAIAAYREAVARAPGLAQAHNNLGTAFTTQGRMDEAIAVFRHALTLVPDYVEIHSNLVFNLHYVPDLDPAVLAAEHRHWDEMHTAPLRKSIAPHTNDRTPSRRLRIGYVSADFRDHVVGRTLLPCFEAHDRSQFDLVCYSGSLPADAIGRRFRELSSEWRLTTPLSDDALARQIREDRIDILVDLALHTAHHRLLVFARRPAPVQISWLGYPGPSGTSAIEHYLSDPFLEPPAVPVPVPAGDPLILPESWCCYAPHADSPEPGGLPAESHGRVTFASFNNFAKINPRVLSLWAAILHRVEGSRLLLLSKSGPVPSAVEAFRQAGIEPSRIEFAGYYAEAAPDRGEQATNAYLARYLDVDIALDPFPYNGMTTTCDAFWMGVPVVALIGDRPIARASFSLLSNAGLPELAAHTEEQYVEIATALAHDLPRLAALRANLRGRMKASPLLDAARLARNVEAAFRTAWQRWCAAAAGE